jgi:hypothetical protein
LLGQVLKISQTAPQTFFFKKDQAVDVLRVLVMEGLNNSDSSLGFKQTVVEIIGNLAHVKKKRETLLDALQELNEVFEKVLRS